MSSIFNRLVRVSTLTNQRSGNRYCLLQHVKWCHDETHYQHGIPGIPTDGKVVLLKNSNTGSQIYLVGTCHVSKESPQLVKKVINSVRPDAIAIEQSKEDLEELRRKNWEPINVNESWFSLFLRSMRSPGGLQRKMNVALEESLKLKAKLIPIDQDRNVFNAKFPINIPWKIYIRRCIALHKEIAKKSNLPADTDSRSLSRELDQLSLIFEPELYKAVTEDRDMHMFTRLRGVEEKLIVAVVGLGHMDGIELLWKRAEDGDDDSKLLCTTSETGGPRTW
ncbi:hypothetical protein MKW98_022951 [Papaver atlanticum]|uniref:TraB domain-containing protein n=1 Tax=Papaver atlanticum TaxID=357466 RepID=A0AAD4TAF0_9MAGN|nr:hypothetical protein MKW98_022951 [Papaver atlanticum]